MSCPLCRSRKEKRFCPALNQTICPVCCGTKRLTEIQCPDTCRYLTSAREHPAAIVKRQQEHDVATLLPTLHGLTERQSQLLFHFQSLIARNQGPAQPAPAERPALIIPCASATIRSLLLRGNHGQAV